MFLDQLAIKGRVSAGTQKQALNALVFYLREVQKKELGDFSDYKRARVKTRLPVVLTKEEVRALFDQIPHKSRLMAQMMYGGGLRLAEVLSLGIMDVDLERVQIRVHGGKGDKDRTTIIPQSLIEPLKNHQNELFKRWEDDRAAKLPGIYIPHALVRKYPKAGTQWPWQWFWPSKKLSTDPETRIIRRHHLHADAFQ